MVRSTCIVFLALLASASGEESTSMLQLSRHELGKHRASSVVDTFRSTVQGKGIYMGAAIRAGLLSDDASYKAKASEQYDLFTAENECKWRFIQPTQGTFDFSKCDRIRDFARHNGAMFRGHTLCWGNMNPDWLQGLDAAAKRQALVQHIEAVAAHYGSDAFAWDVVNEAVTDSSTRRNPLKNSVWYPDVPDYIDLAFTTARKAFGEGVKLFYNDYRADTKNKKSDRIYALVKDMKQRGVPIDGVGLQMHIKNWKTSNIASVKRNMQRFGDLGLEVHITELDVEVPSRSRAWSPARERKQAQIYAALLQACLDVPMCKSFETWGFSDKYTWKGTRKHPLPFDENFEAKAAVGAMMDVLKAAAPGL